MATPISVLHIDDDQPFLEMTAAALEQENERIDVISKSDPVEAAELIEAERSTIDCIISDYDLPTMNGLALLEQVRREHEEIPFLLFTGRGSEELASEAIAAGVTDYLRKGGSEQHTMLANRIVNAVQQYRTTQEPNRTERRLQELADKSNDILWMASSDWNEIEFVNSAVKELLGLSPEQLRAQPRRFFDVVHPDDRERVTSTMSRLESGQSINIEFRVPQTEESHRWLWMQAEPVFDGDGAVERIAGFIRDISERKQRERSLTALNDVAVDLDSYDSVDGICERTIEASEDLLRFDLSVIDIEEDGYLHKAALSANVAPANTATFSIEEGIAGLTYRTGESQLINDLEAHPEADPQGPYRAAISIPIGTHGVFQAVAEEPAAFDQNDLELAELLASHTTSALDRLDRERKLHRQNDRLEEFTRIVSHDIRNPMNVLAGCLDLAQEDGKTDHLHNAATALSRMETVLEDTLTLAREGQIVDEKRAVRLDSIATTSWQTVATGSATLEVTTERHLRADPNRLRHVFENLFRNAIEHGGPDVTVHVGGLEGGFYVEDDGPGIPEENRDQVFDLGYTENGSSGFGLAIVRQVVESHRWQVDVTEGDAGGARFEFSTVEDPDEKPVLR